MEPIRLLLLDDHVLFREGLSRLLASEPDFELVGNCGNSAEALELLRRVTADVVLLDFDLGDDHGSQFISSAHQAGYHSSHVRVKHRSMPPSQQHCCVYPWHTTEMAHQLANCL